MCNRALFMQRSGNANSNDILFFGLLLAVLFFSSIRKPPLPWPPCRMTGNRPRLKKLLSCLLLLVCNCVMECHVLLLCGCLLYGVLKATCQISVGFKKSLHLYTNSLREVLMFITVLINSKLYILWLGMRNWELKQRFQSNRNAKIPSRTTTMTTTPTNTTITPTTSRLQQIRSHTVILKSYKVAETVVRDRWLTKTLQNPGWRSTVLKLASATLGDPGTLTVNFHFSHKKSAGAEYWPLDRDLMRLRQQPNGIRR